MFGYSLEEMKKQSIQSLICPDDVEMVMKYHNGRIYGKNVPSRYECQGVRKDGSIICLEVHAKALKKGRKIVGTRSYLWDITERKRVENELQQTLKKLRKALGSIINVVVSTVEVRDPYTAGHQQRVADLARMIAIEMGLKKQIIDGIRMAGAIHDIGKIALPAEVLSKPSTLSVVEYELIKCHPKIGYEILKNVEFPWPVANIVLQHHERLNGSGYPLGLSGKEIIIEAKILEVADVVEAMTNHRPYRPALGIEVAFKEIENNKDILYDPQVVDACIKLFKEKGFKFKT